MKRITIIVPEGQTNLSTVSCIVGAYEIFSSAIGYWKRAGVRESFKVEIAGLSKSTSFDDGLILLRPHCQLSDIRKTDLVIVPSVARDYHQAMKGNKKVVEWISNQYDKGAEVATMCTGTFMLAAAGMLDGRSCSTHWSAAETFKKLFPLVNLQADQLITDENGIYTNGGAFSFLNLVIYLVEKYFDRSTAIYCSKVFQVEIDRQSQSPFSIFTGQKQHSDEMVQQAQVYIENNIDERISMEDLSAKFAIGRRNFDRRFIKATGNTPLEYAQRVKIESAKKALETSRKTINEVMYEVGYADIKAFRELFRKITGMSPLEYRGRYNKEAAIAN